MKQRGSRILLLGAGVLALVPSLPAAPLSWDANTTALGAQDGSGTWNITNTNWWNGAANVAWNNGTPDTATFGNAGTGGTITVGVPVTAGGLTFNAVAATNYTITGSTLTLAGPSVAANAGATILSTLAGAAGLAKSGGATLTLGGTNTYGGGTLLTAGILLANSSNALGAGPVTITNTALRLVVGAGVILTNPIVIATNAGAAGNGLIQVNSGTGTVRGPVTILNNAAGGGHFGTTGNSLLNVNGPVTASVGVTARVGTNIFSGGGSYANFIIGQDLVGLGAQDGIATNAAMNVAASAAGAFDLRGFNQTLAGLTNTTTARITSPSTGTLATLTLNTPAGNSFVYTGTIASNLALVKAGPGTQALNSGGNSFTGDVTVAEGTLVAGTLSAAPNTALGVRSPSRTLTVQTGATLRLSANDVLGAGGMAATGLPALVVNGGVLDATRFNILGNLTLNAATLSQSSSDTGLYEGFQFLGTVTVGGAAASTISTGNGKANHLFGAGATTFDVADATGDDAADLVVSAPLRNGSGNYPGAGGLTKTGAGTLRLEAHNAFTGAANVNSGTLQLGAAASLTGASVFVNSGGSFDVSALAGYVVPQAQVLGGHGGSVTGSVSASDAARVVGGGLGTPGTLTLASDFIQAATYTNYFDLTNSLAVGGGTNDLLVVQGDFEPLGATVAIHALSPLVGGTYRLINYGSMALTNFNPVLAGNTSRDVWTLDAGTPGQVNLLVVTGAPQALVWAGATTADWDGGFTNWYSPAAAANDRFYDVDSVLFDDAGATVNVVTLGGVVRPSSVTVNAASNYTIAGAGKISDGFGFHAPLTKDGAGSLTLATTNDFTGGTLVSNGILFAGADAAFGPAPIVLAGGGIGASGGPRTVANAVSLAGTAPVVDDGGNTFALSGVISGTGALVKAGAGTLTPAAVNTYSGGSTIRRGTLRQPHVAALGPGPITLGDAGTGAGDVAWLFAGATTPSNPVVVENLGSGTATLGSYSAGTFTEHKGPVTLNRATTMTDATGDRTTFSGPISGGAGTITITGTRITFGNASNSFTGALVVNAGSVYQNDATSAVPAGVSVTANGSFRLNNGGTHVIDALGGGGNATIVAGGNATLSLGNGGGSGVFSGSIANGAAVLSLVKNGSGTQVFSGVSSYTGPTTIAGGTLALGAGGSITGTPRLIVQAPGTFDVSGAGGFSLGGFRSLEGFGLVTGDVSASPAARLVPGAQAVAGTLAFANGLGLNAASTNYFDLAVNDTTAGGGVNDLVEVGGLLEPSNSVIAISVPAQPFSNGTYRLFNYSGAKTTGFNPAVPGNTTRKSWTIDESTAGQVNLVIAGDYASLRWNPLVSTNWDLAAANWQDLNGLTNTTFFQSDLVLFDDAGAFSNGVSLGTVLRPLDFVVRSSSNYTIVGTGRVSGVTGVTKDGTGTLTLGGTANDYTGAVVISNGVLRAATASALGSTSGVTVVTGNGALDVNGLNLGQEVVQILGAGNGGAGTIINSGASQINALQYVQLLGDASIGGNGNRWDVRAGTAPYVNLNGYTLTKAGTGYVSFVAAAVTNSGNLVINAGVLSLETTSAVGGPGSIHANPAGTLQFYQGTTAINKPVVLNGGLMYCAAASSIASPILITTNSTIGTGGGAMSLTNVLSGPGGLTKTNANTLNLTGENTYGGGTTVAGGELQIGNNTASGSIVGIISNFASVYFYRTNAITLVNPITGTGNVYFRTAAGATVDGAAPISNAYIAVGQTFYGKLVINPGAQIFTSGNFQLGNPTGVAGDVVQHGGDVTVNGAGTTKILAIAHWGTEVSSYLMGGGTLTVTNGPIDVGSDGVGLLTVTGGVVTAKGIAVDGNGNTAAVNGTNETFTFTGGRVILGSSGLFTGGGGSTFLGGGTLGAYTNWASSLAMQLSGTNGNTAVDPAGWTITLSGALSGTGGLVKTGTGQLSLAGAGSFMGGVLVSNGTVAMTGAGVLANSNGNFVTVQGGGRFTLGKVNAITAGHGIACLVPVTLDGGVLELLGDSENRLGAITLNDGGTILLNGGDTSVGDWGALYLPDPITVGGTSPSVITNTAAPFSTVRLGTNTLFNVSDVTSNSAVDLQCYAPLLNQAGTLGAGGFTKTGAGTMASHGPNGFAGTCHVSNGTLLVHGVCTGSGATVVSSGATLGGTGTLGGAVISDGFVAPGAGAGMLTIATGYTQNPSGALNIEIGGLVQGTDHDVLSVAGNATLGGALNVSLINAFAPTTNDSFAILLSGSLSGTFATTNLPALGGGDAWNVQYIAGVVLLSVTNTGAPPPPAGYDLFALQITNGLTGYQQDADGDGYANLLEYVTGGDPTNADQTARMNSGRTNGVLSLKFTRSTVSTDATIHVEGGYAATNNAVWQNVAVNTNGLWTSGTAVETGGPGTVDVTVQDTDPAATNRFMRLRVTRP